MVTESVQKGNNPITNFLEESESVEPFHLISTLHRPCLTDHDYYTFTSFFHGHTSVKVFFKGNFTIVTSFCQHRQSLGYTSKLAT